MCSGVGPMVGASCGRTAWRSIVTIDFSEAIRPPRLSTEGGVLLGIRLLKSKPIDLDKTEKRALRAVRAAILEVQRVGKARERLRPQNLKDEDQEFDQRWGAVHGQLDAWARLAGDPRGEEADALIRSLFPDGLTFLTRSYEDEWVASERRLERIEEEGLEERLTALVHPDLLREVRAAHAALGEGLGVGKKPLELPDGRALLESLRALSLAISDYARVLSAKVERGDAKSERRFEEALAPLFHHRAGRGGGAGHDEERPEPPVTPSDPVGPVLDEPVPPVR